MYDNFVGGRWLAPAGDRYLAIPPGNPGVRGCRVARSCAADVERALNAAQGARAAWSLLQPEARAAYLRRTPDRASDHGVSLALADACDRGVAAHRVDWRRINGVVASLTAPLSRLLATFEDGDDRLASIGTASVLRLAFVAGTEVEAMCERVVPLLLHGDVVVAALLYDDARRLPVRLLALMGLLACGLPPGVLNVVTGLGLEAGVALVAGPQARRSSVAPARSGRDRAAAHRDLGRSAHPA